MFNKFKKNVFAIGFGEIDRTIKKQAKKNKSIIYGARSINAQVSGVLRRQTGDYDLFSKAPKKSATNIANKLNRKAGYPFFFVKPAMHPGTQKVMHIGQDLKKNTQDDYNIADYTKMPKNVPYIVRRGVRYRKLTEEEKAKLKSLRDKQYAFRHKKDAYDLQSIQSNKRLKRGLYNGFYTTK